MIAKAKEIAAALDADPVMARQVKEHIKANRLIEVLELTPEHLSDEELEAELERRQEASL